MDTKKLGTVAGLVGVLAGLIQIIPAWAFARGSAATEIPGWAPMIGSMGQTIVFYNYLADIVGPLGTLLVAVGFGYYVGQRLNIAREYRRFIGAVMAGSTISVVIMMTAMLHYGWISFMNLNTGAVLILLAYFFSEFVSIALIITVGAVAGAAVAHFQSADSAPPQQPAEAPTETPSAVNHESSTDQSDLRSQSAQ